MEHRTQLLGIFISLLFLAVVLLLVYKRRLREEYSLLWLLGLVVLLGLSIFRGILAGAAGMLGIGYAPSLLFTVSALFGLIIMLSHAVVITTLVCRNRDLAQKIALLEWHVDQLELGGSLTGADGGVNKEKSRKVDLLFLRKEKELSR
jgi:hypothetical protein